MSDPPEARPGAPKAPARPPAPTTLGLGGGGGVRPPSPSSSNLGGAVSRPPVAPRVPTSSARTPPAAPTTPRMLPDTKSSQNLIDGAGDTEEMELRSSAVIPAAEEFRPPPVAPLVGKRASSPDLSAPRAPMPSHSDVAAQADVADRVQQVLAEVLMSTLAPVIEKQRELEARLETLKAMPVRAPVASIDITGSFSPAAPSVLPPPVGGGGGKIISTSYGPVSVRPGPAPRAAIDEALDKVGPIDVPDFGGKRRLVGRIVIAILILGVLGAIAATVLSYS